MEAFRQPQSSAFISTALLVFKLGRHQIGGALLRRRRAVRVSKNGGRLDGKGQRWQSGCSKVV